MKRIFYFNITYGCNSNCIFCYSHNTHHGAVTYNEISSDCFFQYLEEKHLSSCDRVIINGGEPLLHSEIETILSGLMRFECEILVYTNGRLLNQFDFSKLTKNYRFVVPIHGYEEIHDDITGVKGSYRETINGIASLTNNTECLLDIKLIINNKLLSEDREGKKLLASLAGIQFNNAVHITKMADTIISIRNNCESICNSNAANYTKLLFEHFREENRIVKIFDTCVYELNLDSNSFAKYESPIVVYFKDKDQFREMDLSRNILSCMNNCVKRNICLSAVDEYKVLEYNNGKIYENLE